jgi:hypothetical protein
MQIAYYGCMRIAAVRVIVLMLALTLAGPAAWAAPTCQDRAGMTTRCGTEHAMPVGWTAPEADRNIPAGSVRDLWGAVGGILLLFALIALLPEFDGSQEEDWVRSGSTKENERVRRTLSSDERPKR